MNIFWEKIISLFSFLQFSYKYVFVLWGRRVFPCEITQLLVSSITQHIWKNIHTVTFCVKIWCILVRGYHRFSFGETQYFQFQGAQGGGSVFLRNGETKLQHYRASRRNSWYASFTTLKTQILNTHKKKTYSTTLYVREKGTDLKKLTKYTGLKH